MGFNYFTLLFSYCLWILVSNDNGDVLFFLEARRIADEAVGVADMDERVNRGVIAANHEANHEAAIL